MLLVMKELYLFFRIIFKIKTQLTKKVRYKKEVNDILVHCPIMSHKKDSEIFKLYKEFCFEDIRMSNVIILIISMRIIKLQTYL